jgi:metal-responsive CopG/Arc/MetJ family transcriptional regulator
MSAKTVKIMIYLPKDLDVKLRREVNRAYEDTGQKTSMSEICRQAIAEYLDKPGKNNGG